jgi:hypothetical protein
MNTLKIPTDIQESGRWAEDTAAGRELATAWIDQAQKAGEGAQLAFALRDLVKAGRCTGVEVGFFHGIASACVR